MKARGHRSTAAALAALGLAATACLVTLGPAPARAADAPLELKWHQLVPPAPPKKLKSFLAGRSAAQDDQSNLGNPPGSSHAGAPEGRWMSSPLKAGETPAPVVTALNGKRVRIGGYVVSLDFDATRVKEFLLVPFVGACIHVPPPPANQIVYVKSQAGFEVSGMFEPVWVTGTLKVVTAHTGLAEAGYSLTADKVEHRQPPG